MRKITRLAVIVLILLIAIFAVSCGDRQEAPSLTGIYLASQPTYTEYEVGEVFNSAGMAVKAIFSDGTEKVVTDYTYDKMSALTSSDTLVTVSYKDKSVGLIISVSEPESEKPSTFTFKVTAGENGEFTVQKNDADFPMTSATGCTVENGANMRITVKANDDYIIETYTENGKAVNDFAGLGCAVASYSLTENYDISVTFKKDADDVTYQRTTSELTEHFKSYFYNESGEVKCNKLEGFTSAEWAVGAKDGIIPLKVFKDITGMDVSFSESYSYRFVSRDGQITISITGNTTAGGNSEYATMKISIPSCSDIQTIHIGNEQYFNGADYGDVPVIFIGR